MMFYGSGFRVFGFTQLYTSDIGRLTIDVWCDCAVLQESEFWAGERDSWPADSRVD